jgi:transcriptional regulator NrdR family protein
LRKRSDFGYDVKEIARRDDMTREKIVEAIQSASENNRLSCEKAHELARDLNSSLQEIGALCNELKIKITACQLGCF